MTTAIGTQLRPYVEENIEDKSDDNDTCKVTNGKTKKMCGKSPTTHYALCPTDGSPAKTAFCGDHATRVRNGWRDKFTFSNSCGHRIPYADIILFPK